MTDISDVNDAASVIGMKELGNRMTQSMGKLPEGGKPFKQHRDYGRIPTALWTGERVPAFSRLSANAKLVALYLLSSPHANMLGLYRLPLAYLAHDTGLSPDASEAALTELATAGLVKYGKDHNYVWVQYFILTQVLADAERLKPTDNQSIHVQRVLDSLAGAPFVDDLLEAHGQALNLRRLQ